MKEKKESKIKKAPSHIGVIIDGNRRWAKERNLSGMEGHLAGYKKLRQSVSWFFERGVEVLSFYAFSTENWKRSREEVNYLMKLLKQAIDEEITDANKRGYRVLISGRVDELPGDLPQTCLDVMDQTKNNKNRILNICLNYGGRPELIDAVKKIIKNKISIGQIHEGIIKKYLYQPELPDPDIIIRTSGEQRLSGFLLWQSSYSELIFLNKYWPDFEESDVDMVIGEYSSRQRRFGQ